MNKLEMLKDTKVKAVMDLANEVRDSGSDNTHKQLFLTQLLDSGMIPYLLNELPEGETYSYYCRMIDDYVVAHMTKRRKK